MSTTRSLLALCIGMKKLKFEEVLCSICRGIFVEPVTLPCRHIICLQCIERTIESNSLSCPICRCRIGSCIRHAKGLEKMVNKNLWKEIQKQFPKEIEMKQNGEEDGLEERIFSSRPRPSVVTVKGSIKEEFDLMINNLKLEEEKTRLAQQEASEKLAKQLMEEEITEEINRKLKSKEIEEEDEAFVKKLIMAEKVNGSAASLGENDNLPVQNGRDSISVECRHFTPICIMPKTPPKLLPNGQLRDYKILKPINLATSSHNKRNFHYISPQSLTNKTTLKVCSNNFLRTKPIINNWTINNDRNFNENYDNTISPIDEQELLQRKILQEQEDFQIAIKLHKKWNEKKSHMKRNHRYFLRSNKKTKI